MNKNLFEVIGNVGADVKVIVRENGSLITYFSVATKNDYKDKETEQWIKKDPTWIDIVCFGKLAEKATVIKKGERLFVNGRIANKQVTNEKGETSRTLSLIAKHIEKTNPLKTTNNGFTIDDETLEAMSKESGL